MYDFLKNALVLVLGVSLYGILFKDLRESNYKKVSQSLQSLSAQEITNMITAENVKGSSWGKNLKLTIQGVPVFVKLIPLNELEKSSDDLFKTANAWNIPLVYQYGVNSSGFNAFREIYAAQLCTDWVLKKETVNFPLMYHWRVIENFVTPEEVDEKDLREYFAYWNNSKEIEQRTRANLKVPYLIAVFLEYIPENLNNWLEKQVATQDGAKIDTAFSMIEHDVIKTAKFLDSKNMYHFDAHFDNLLTDGTHVYFSDFGLANSLDFSLTEEEKQFLKMHKNYDLYYVMGELVDAIISKIAFKDNKDLTVEEFQDFLRRFLNNECKSDELPSLLTPYLQKVLKKYGKVALIGNQFSYDFRTKSKLTPYPYQEFEQALSEAN